LDQAAPDQVAADGCFAVAPEEHPVRENDRAPAGALERGDEMEEEGVVAVLRRWDAVLEAAKRVVRGIEAVRPGLRGEGRIGHGEVEALEQSASVGEARRGERVAPLDLGRRVAVQDHVHARHRPRRHVHLLPEDGQPLGCFVGGLD